MSKSKVLTGAPWHIEYAGQGKYHRKYRERCGYYDLKTGKCTFLKEDCHTETACHHYWIKKRRPIQQNSNGAKTAPVKKSCYDFVGVQEIEISSILVGGQPTPRDEEYKKILDFYQTHNNKFEHPIMVIYSNGKYLLQKNYPTYYVAKSLGLKRIFAKIDSPIAKEMAKHKTVGKTINHSVFGTGRITAVEGNIITVLFNSGKQTDLDIETCIKNKYFL